LDFGLFLDITGIGVLFGGEEVLARAVIADLAGLGYEARLGIAGTVGAAWAASQESEVRSQGSERVQGSGFGVQDQATPDSRLPTPDSLPLSSLRLPPETLTLLAQLGIERLDQLLALPRASLRARFGELLLLRIDQFTGAAQETIVAYRPPPKFVAEKVLEYPTEQRELIEQVVQDLIHQVAAALAERREGVVQLACRFDCAPGQPVTIDVGLFRPSASPQHLGELVRMQLEQVRLPGAVGRFTLQAKLIAPLENRQGQLFTGNQDEADRQFGLLIDRLSSRLGQQAVLRPQLVADPLPERSVRWEPAVDRSEISGQRSGRARSERQVLSTQYSVLSTKPRRTSHVEAALAPQSKIQNPKSKIHRPLTLDLPHVLQVTSIFPDGPPLAFHFQGRQHCVAHYCGPERIETGWWRGAGVRRDYYRVETEAGLRFWLFRDLKTGDWHLHGEFS
jgi:protein ImuB